MWAKALHRMGGLLLVVAYAAATVVAAASPVAACLPLAHPQGVDHTHHHHHDGSGSRPSDCLKCCVGTCLIGMSLPVPCNGASSLAFDGTPVVYAFEQSALADRSVPPDPTPPRPIT